MAHVLQNIRNDISNAINDESRLVGKLFGKIEQKSGRSRYQVAVMLAIWMFYWVIFGLFRIVDYFAECISIITPIYWLLKCIFFVWLFTPSCLGAQTLYEKFFQPRYSHLLSGCTTAVEMTTE
ncbi:Receptor expression-enhancing protein 3-A [Trichinella zimbabwensis]|uniref:Receptor expression-enhancing protein n=1 Tax=Trichinella zimbabwensis TaxID=268475 RepID=A0A0V1HG11_9BILA|nr:Receptor expression-enhancing protein 3-A [Trichinella zimbabwensis]